MRTATFTLPRGVSGVPHGASDVLQAFAEAASDVPVVRRVEGHAAQVVPY